MAYSTKTGARKVFVIASSLCAEDYAFVEDLTNQGCVFWSPEHDGTPVGEYRDILRAIAGATELHVIFDPEDADVIFQLGMSYAMGKRIVIHNPQDVDSEVIKEWAKI